MIDESQVTTDRISLEKEALAFSIANETHPRIYELPEAEGRALLDEVQSSPIKKANVDIEDRQVSTGQWGDINVRIMRPEANYDVLPVILYLHGAGWVFGGAHTHDKLIRELAVRTHSVIVFPEYSLSPEAKYPTAIEQNYAVMNWLVEHASELKIDASRLTVSGDSVGGNMATVMTIMSKQRKGPKISQQLLYYPVTDANFETGSYNEFAEGYFLTKEGMQWFWDKYTNDPDQRAEITASPLRASLEDLKDLPAAMILNGEADVLRDEGEAYAKKLRDAGVEVTHMRFQGMVHDFVMVNMLDSSKATRAAMDVSTKWLNKRNQK
ncbi:alpha/beta hydrolase [Companilactobacillus versmoldensis]|uniref:Lipase n=1 Tax=Companilactobacillus versmoldensis DSM 14857 = KCTC 3814 TaxID=1423815 RepID=A0A0R1SDM6_9LACO|nr:alpha/beta hydrolase [Companilactobacillus versmoldensis]KRL66670.1 lipase [Companilactobacillus versmoldensis DSM 14857 = KCTC 3814]